MFPHCRSLSHLRCLGGDGRKITHACYYAYVCANTRANREPYYACSNDRDDGDDADNDDEDALLFFVFAGRNWDTVLRQRRKHARKRGETS